MKYDTERERHFEYKKQTPGIKKHTTLRANKKGVHQINEEVYTRNGRNTSMTTSQTHTKKLQRFLLRPKGQIRTQGKQKSCRKHLLDLKRSNVLTNVLPRPLMLRQKLAR